MASSATSNNPNSSISPRHTTDNRGSRPSRQVSSSPWTQIVRGGESVPTLSASNAAVAPSSRQSKAAAPIETIPSPPSPPASSSVSTAAGDERSEGNAGKKPVWRRPSNGADAATVASEVGPVVMGASSWPALSETTTTNKSSSDSLKSLGGGDVAPSSPPVLVSQGIANASAPASKPVGRANANPTPNHSRQRSFKKNTASGSSANGTASQPSAQGSLAESPSHNPSPRGQNQRNGFPSQTHGGGGGGGGTDNVHQRDSSHRNQNGNHHQSHGGRRNQENQNWTFNRSFNGRDGNVHSQRGGAPAFVRHAPPPVQPIPQFMAAAQPVPPFASPLAFPPELASQYYQRMPFVAPLSPAPVFYHVQDPPLNIKLQKQIQYYFSEENLIKDTYLRRQMDDQGFVPLPVIAGFKKVAELTDSIQQIADALQGSPVVEIQGDRIRKRYNWQHWLLPEEPNPAVSSPQSVGAVASRVGNLSLGESSAGPNGGSSSQLQSAGAENKAVSDGQQQSSGVDPVSNRNDSDGATR